MKYTSFFPVNYKESPPDSLIGKTFFKKYLLVQKLGEGSFGCIYMGVYNNEKYALKFEKKKQGNCLLESESYFLNYLKSPYIPSVKSYGASNNYNILVMELLGKSLEDLLMSSPEKRFSVRTVCNIGVQMLTAVSFIHTKHIIHRDIKPDNFVTGLRNKMNEIYLIDFGLSKKYRSSTTLAHYPMKKKKLTGTARYASINALKGFEQSRRDDLESIAYVLIYLLNGKLPWQGMLLKSKEDRYQKIIEMKENIHPNELCKGHPKQFAKFVSYTRKLEYEQNPNYEHLKKLLIEVLKEINCDYDLYSDWFQPNSNISLPLLNEDSNQVIDNSIANNDQYQYNIGLDPNQITVSKTIMNQINNIVIINNHSDNHVAANQTNKNSSSSPPKMKKELSSKELKLKRPLRQVESNQAVDASLENHLKDNVRVEERSGHLQNDPKNKSYVDNAGSNHDALFPVPLFQKKVDIPNQKQCSMCCFVY